MFGLFFIQYVPFQMQCNSLIFYNIYQQGVEIENCHLKESLANEKTRSLDLKNELTNEKTRILDLENEVKELKSRCICSKPSANILEVSTHGSDFDLSHYQMAKTPEVLQDLIPTLFLYLYLFLF